MLCRAVVSLGCLLVATAAPAANWPQFRGPDGAGVAAEGPTYPDRFGPDERVAWKTALPSGASSPCVWGDRIFLTGCDADAKKLETLALDRRTGQVVWRKVAPAETIETVHKISSPAAGTVATDGERVYVYFGSCGLLCYDFAGAEVWKHPLPMPQTRFGTGTSPVVAGELVLLHADQPPQPYLLAVNRRTGAAVWRRESLPVNEGYATPLVWRHDGIEEVVVHSPGRVAAYALADGAERWWVGIFSTACTSPVAADGRLFVGTWMLGGEAEDRVKLPGFDELLAKHDANKDGQLSNAEFPDDLSLLKRIDAGDLPGADLKAKRFFGQLDINKDGQLGRLEWGMVSMAVNRPIEHGLLAVKPGGTGDVTRTHVVWREKKAAPEVPTPLVYRGRVYAVRAGIVSCLDAASGKVVYRERIGGSDAYFASPVAGDGKVYFAAHPGHVTVLAAGDTFQVLARNRFPDPILATPALVDGTIYLRTEKYLYAIGGPTP